MPTVKNFNDFNDQEVNESRFNAQFFADKERAMKRMENDRANRAFVGDIVNYLESFKSLSKSDINKIYSQIEELVSKHK